MTNRTYHMPKPICAAFSMLALCGLGTCALAQEYCVTCTEPTAKYRCILSGAPSPEAAKTQGQLLCITELARSGNHASCAVGATNSGPCVGEVKTVMFPAVPDPTIPPIAEAPPDAPPAPAAAVPAEAPPAAGAVASTEPAPEQAPPKTVEELAKTTVKTSSDSLKKAGNAVGGAVKKTWGCLSSFFSDC